MRWREIHQSGRVAIMLAMRSSPQLGSQRTFLISSSARARNVAAEPSGFSIGVSMLMNHCSVARKITGLMAAPAVRIRVIDVHPRQQRAALLQQLDNRLIRRKNFLALILRQSIVQPSRAVHIAGWVQPIPHAGIKVIRTVRWGCMDRARAGIRRHVVRQHTQNAALQKRMLKCRALQFPSQRSAQSLSHL